MSKKLTYFKNSIYYTGISIIKNGLAFITLPVMTRFLLPKDYGTIGLITMIVSFSNLFFLGLNNATYRLYFKYNDDNNTSAKLISTNIYFILSAAGIYTSLLILAFSLLNHFFFTGTLNIIWIIIALFQFALSYINMINQMIIQIKQDGKKWFFNELTFVSIQVPLSLFLVITKIFTFQAVILSNFIAEFVKFIIIYFQTRKNFKLTFSTSLFKESLIYSWPSIPTNIISFGYSYIDRIIISRVSGVAQVGILDMGNRVALILRMIIDGISGVFSPVTVGLIKDNTSESLEKLAELNLKLMYFFSFLGLGLILFNKELIMLLTTKAYYSIIYIVPLQIFYQIFSVLGMISYWLIYYHPKNTFWQIPINLFSLIISTLANILMIPSFGAVGAGIALFVSALLTQAAQLIIGLRLTPIPIKYGRLVSIFIGLFVETGILYYLYSIKLSIFEEFGIKIIMLGIFFIFGWILNLITIDEIKLILDGIKKKFFKKGKKIKL